MLKKWNVLLAISLFCSLGMGCQADLLGLDESEPAEQDSPDEEAEEPAGGGTTGEDSPDPDLSATMQQMLDLVNELRSDGCTCGQDRMPAAPALQWNDKLAAAALAHAKDMETNNYFGHISQDGRQLDDRVEEQGYAWSRLGENIAGGYTTVSSVVQGWIDSPGHCRNLMNGSFTELGAGRSGRIWVQNFGRPR